MIWWGKGERNEVFIISFAKENLFKHGISFDVVGATIGRLFIFIKYTFFMPVILSNKCIVILTTSIIYAIF